MATHEVIHKIIWHDLTEDPNDLPTNEKQCFWTLVASKDTRLPVPFRYDFDTDLALWIPEEKVWRYYYGDRVHFARSYGDDSAKFLHCFPDGLLIDEEVIAWAERHDSPYYIPEPYRPEAVEAWLLKQLEEHAKEENRNDRLA